VSIPFRSGRLSQRPGRLPNGLVARVSIPFRSGRLSQACVFAEIAKHLEGVRVSIPFRSGRLSQERAIRHAIKVAWSVNPLQIGVPFTDAFCGAPLGGYALCQSPSDRGGFHRAHWPRAWPVSSSVNPLQIGASFTDERRQVGVLLLRCVNPLQIGAPFTDRHRYLLRRCRRVSIPFRSGRLSQRGSCHDPLLRPARVSIPFRSGRLSQLVFIVAFLGVATVCQSPSDRGAFHRRSAPSRRSSRTSSVSIPFRSGRLSQVDRRTMATHRRHVSIPFRSGRLSQYYYPADYSAVRDWDRGVNPLEIGAPFTDGPLPYPGGGLYRCQSPSDRGAFHRWRKERWVGKAVEMCQSPSDRGAFHRVCIDYFFVGPLPVSIPFRSGRLSQSPKNTSPLRGGGRCQSPSDRGVLHRVL